MKLSTKIRKLIKEYEGQTGNAFCDLFESCEECPYDKKALKNDCFHGDLADYIAYRLATIYYFHQTQKLMGMSK